MDSKELIMAALIVGGRPTVDKHQQPWWRWLWWKSTTKTFDLQFVLCNYLLLKIRSYIKTKHNKREERNYLLGNPKQRVTSMYVITINNLHRLILYIVIIFSSYFWNGCRFDDFQIFSVPLKKNMTDLYIC